MTKENITTSEIERRTKIAKMLQLELAVEKDSLALEDKKRNLCRIDLALDAFDDFLKDFVQMMFQFPDFVQSVYPEGNPEQYKRIQDFIDDNIQRLAQKRIHLALESTREECEAATEIKNESIRKAVKIRKADKG